MSQPRIRLPRCGMFVTERCPAEQRERAQTMLGRLKLGKGEDVVEQRLEWYRMSLDGDLTLEGLERKAPLVAHAIRKERAQRADLEAPRE